MAPDNTSQKITFVTGKGGVGKSTVALAQARRLARQGHRALLVELGERSYFADLLGLPQISQQPLGIAPNLAIAHWTPEPCLREYILQFLKLDRLYRLFFENKVMKAFIDIAPGLREVSLLGKITSGLRGIGAPLPYDHIIVDCFATGHALAFFRSPVGLGKVVKVGPMGEQCASILRVLQDPRLCQYWIVSLLEELPVSESLELCRDLHRELNIAPRLIANKVLVPPVTREELDLISKQNLLDEARDFVAYLRQTLSRQTDYLSQLETVAQNTGDSLGPNHAGESTGRHVTKLKLLFANQLETLMQSMENELGA